MSTILESALARAYPDRKAEADAADGRRDQERDALEQRRNRYVFALMAHDWQYEYSDDGRVYRQGREERAALVAEQQTIDPEFETWNMHCPAQFRRGVV